MPVTIRTANHSAREWQSTGAVSHDALFKGSCPQEYKQSQRIIQTGLSHPLEHNHVTDAENGFVDALTSAYSNHHHLTLRPEDIWFTILSQVSFFINANAEELRAHFVAHEGRKELTVTAAGSVDTADFGAMAHAMTTAIQDHVVDAGLRAWIMPEFSTTTANDRVVAAVLMMGSMQKYFTYQFCLMCGIPSVTLLGERRDWEMLLGKLDRLPALGQEPTRFAELLRPVLTRFLTSFDEPTANAVRHFWGRCADRHSGGSGPSYLSGWVTAFCFWDPQGRRIRDQSEGNVASCELDGVRYPWIDTADIPPAYASVPVRLDDNGTVYETVMVAGMMGVNGTSSGLPLKKNGGAETTGLDSLQPVAGWVMYQKKDNVSDRHEEY
ncbi:DUF4419 domain-containing protein [Aspergillus saccharolyticus JOP 1030-1]|uniref:DUF4419 domain-containing protein n=1 Tax=Aspergillus saccharolyticus JOP 1030-1 TaxID=1450539 RepID=A0A318ZVM0_9EURO|nr:hypothetical protein BP01DRAFT_313181 [Aspergillus saccharolyticus JOP 1030-1]PYH48110.1 hypothetical protein BP01DRAFT_313181 [Aspergillus saccharolyticus JOP 1030-1]